MNLEARYAGKRPLLKHLQARCLDLLGNYAAQRKIEWDRVERLVFVCKGNICRSPYAEARARALGLTSVSFGLDTPGGNPANPSALRVGRSRGVDLSSHTSRPLRSASLGAADLVMVFEPEQLELAREQLKACDGVQLSLAGLWATPSRPYVADPYGCTDAYFTTCFTAIDSAVSAMARVVKRAP